MLEDLDRGPGVVVEQPGSEAIGAAATVSDETPAGSAGADQSLAEEADGAGEAQPTAQTGEFTLEDALGALLAGAALGAVAFGVKAALRRAFGSQELSARPVEYRPSPRPPVPTVPPAAPTASSGSSSAASEDPEFYARLVRSSFDTLRSGHQLRMGALGKTPGPQL